MARVIGLVVTAFAAVFGFWLAAGALPAGAQSTTWIDTSVVNSSGTGASGVDVDLFEADESGSRLSYLTTATTGDDGAHRFELDTGGCYSMVFIAPSESRFVTGNYFQTFRCIETGSSAEVIAELQPASETATIITEVVEPDGPVPGVDVDLFTAATDGTRGSYLQSASTGADGTVSFEQPGGCYVVVAIAGEGAIFTNGTGFWENPVCVESGSSARVLAVLEGQSGGVAIYEGTVIDTDGSGVQGATVEVWAATSNGNRSNYLLSQDSGPNGSYRIELNAGCYLTVTLTPPDQRYESLGNYVPLFICLDSGQVFEAVTPPVVALTGPAVITGQVQTPPDGFSVEVLLFESNQDGEAGEFIESIFLPGDGDSNGRYQFELEPGCYLVELAAPVTTKLSTGNPTERYANCLGGGQSVTLPSVHILPGSAVALDFDRTTGVAYLPANDRIAVAGDNEVQIWSGDGQLLHTVDRLPEVSLPTGTADNRVVVYVRGTNQLVVINSDDGSIVRQINPGVVGISSIDVVGDVIWYAHGPDQWDAGIGRARLSEGDGEPYFYDGTYAGSLAQASPARPERVYVVARGLSPTGLDWYGPNETFGTEPYHDSFWPFSVADDGEVWAVNNGFITQMDPDDLTRTGRAIGVPPSSGRLDRVTVDGAFIHLATSSYIRSYDRSTLLQSSQTPTYLDLVLRHSDARGNRRVAILSTTGSNFQPGDYFLAID